MSVYVWSRYRINYIYLFEFDPRNVDTPIDIFNDAVDETFVFLVSMVMYYKVSTQYWPCYGFVCASLYLTKPLCRLMPMTCHCGYLPEPIHYF